MALIECKECKKEISSDAKACPNCGYKKSTPISSLIFLIIGGTLLGAVAITSGKNPPNPATQIEETQPAEELPALGPNVWEYQIPIDQASGKAFYTATIQSENKVDLKFPYDGGVKATLFVRKHPRHGLDVVVAVNKGQLNCEYDNCYISIRYDDGDIAKYNVTEPADHSRQSYFIDKTKKTISQIKKAKKMYIELTFFQQGSHTFEFNVQNFDDYNFK